MDPKGVRTGVFAETPSIYQSKIKKSYYKGLGKTPVFTPWILKYSSYYDRRGPEGKYRGFPVTLTI